MGYDQHQESVGVAKEALSGVQAAVRAAIELHDSAMGAVVHAVGDQPAVDSGRHAYEMVGVALERLNDAVTALEVAKENLNQYGVGF